jgi:hypothetical protein
MKGGVSIDVWKLVTKSIVLLFLVGQPVRELETRTRDNHRRNDD